MATTDDIFKKWFPAYQKVNYPSLRIIAIHSAGSAENIFTGKRKDPKDPKRIKRIPNHLMDWAKSQDVEVLSCQLPGREKRRTEPFVKSAQEAANDIFKVLNDRNILNERVPYIFLAHSMGSFIAYEILVKIREVGNIPKPAYVFISCFPSPDIPEELRPWRKNAKLSEEELKKECKMWDVNAIIFQKDVWVRYLPMLRADFTLFDSYIFDQDKFAPFDIPMHVFYANKDRMVSEKLVKGWESFTNGRFDVKCLQGNHLFIYDDTARDTYFEFITELIYAKGII